MGHWAFGNDLLAQGLPEQGFSKPLFICTWCDSKKGLNSEQTDLFSQQVSSCGPVQKQGFFFPHIFPPLGILNINLPCTIGILSWISPLFVCFSVTQKITASWWKHLVTWAFSNRNLLSEGIQRAASTGNQKQSWLEWGSLFDIKCEIAA